MDSSEGPSEKSKGSMEIITPGAYLEDKIIKNDSIGFGLSGKFHSLSS